MEKDKWIGVFTFEKKLDSIYRSFNELGKNKLCCANKVVRSLALSIFWFSICFWNYIKENQIKRKGIRLCTFKINAGIYSQRKGGKFWDY